MTAKSREMRRFRDIFDPAMDYDLACRVGRARSKDEKVRLTIEYVSSIFRPIMRAGKKPGSLRYQNQHFFDATPVLYPP
jgi:hypothetical protein